MLKKPFSIVLATIGGSAYRFNRKQNSYLFACDRSERIEGRIQRCVLAPLIWLDIKELAG